MFRRLAIASLLTSLLQACALFEFMEDPPMKATTSKTPPQSSSPKRRSRPRPHWQPWPRLVPPKTPRKPNRRRDWSPKSCWPR